MPAFSSFDTRGYRSVAPELENALNAGRARCRCRVLRAGVRL